MASRTGYSLVGLAVVLVLAVVALPWLRNAFAPMFPEGFLDGSNCRGVTCQEGEFCQDSVCRPVSAPITNNYWKMA